MHDFSFLQDLLILLAVALGNALLFSQLRQSPIVGYLVTGVLIGPFGFHLIQGTTEVEVMAEFGVIMLLFTIGLEFSGVRIAGLKRLLLRTGTAQIVLTVGLVGVLLAAAGIAPATAVCLGLAASLSSTAIVLKVLLESGRMESAVGRISLAILLGQDLCVIIFLVILPLLAGGISGFNLRQTGQALLLLGGLYGFSRYLLHPLLHRVLKTRSAELFRLTVLALTLGTAWATEQAGLSLALGAFLAGMALAESAYAHQVLADTIPFRDVFLAIFFIAMGMLIDSRLLIGNLPWLLAGLVILLLLKTLTGTLAASLSRYPLRTAMVTGLTLFQVGEFAFILMKRGLDLHLMSMDVYQYGLSLTALSMLVSPLLISKAPELVERLWRTLRLPSDPWVDPHQEQTGNLTQHVIIAGYGFSGRNVSRVLREIGVPYLHIELNGDTVRRARSQGEFVVYGDVTSPEVLRGIGLERAGALVLAINDPPALSRAIRAAREINPKLFILVRCRYLLERERLKDLGAQAQVTDEIESGLQLATLILRRYNISEGKILSQVARLRRETSQQPEAGQEPESLSGYLSILDNGGIEFQAVPETSSCIGKTLQELEFRARSGVTVVGLVRDQQIRYNLPLSQPLASGDTLLLLGSPDDLTKARNLLHDTLG
jgi:K+:H+ antiporter